MFSSIKLNIYLLFPMVEMLNLGVELMGDSNQLVCEKRVVYCTQSHREVCSNSFLVLWAANTVSSMFLFQLSIYLAMLVLLHGTE